MGIHSLKERKKFVKTALFTLFGFGTTPVFFATTLVVTKTTTLVGLTTTLVGTNTTTLVFFATLPVTKDTALKTKRLAASPSGPATPTTYPHPLTHPLTLRLTLRLRLRRGVAAAASPSGTRATSTDLVGAGCYLTTRIISEYLTASNSCTHTYIVYFIQKKLMKIFYFPKKV
jgi:hypothetical protein